MTGVPGPFETEREARQSPPAQAVFEAFDADPGAGKMAPHNLAMLTEACEAAQVVLGAYDRRILAWLSGWEPATCAVIAGLIGRAGQRAEAASGHGARAVTFDLMTGDDYFVLTDALEEWDSRQRHEAADEPDGNAESRIRWADRADAMLDRIDHALHQREARRDTDSLGAGWSR